MSSKLKSSMSSNITQSGPPRRIAKKNKVRRKGKRFQADKEECAPSPLKKQKNSIGETLQEECQEDQGFESTLGESIYEDFDA